MQAGGSNGMAIFWIGEAPPQTVANGRDGLSGPLPPLSDTWRDIVRHVGMCERAN